MSLDSAPPSRTFRGSAQNRPTMRQRAQIPQAECRASSIVYPWCEMDGASSRGGVRAEHSARTPVRARIVNTTMSLHRLFALCVGRIDLDVVTTGATTHCRHQNQTSHGLGIIGLPIHITPGTGLLVRSNERASATMDLNAGMCGSGLPGKQSVNIRH